jgi:hypothetical protein
MLRPAAPLKITDLDEPRPKLNGRAHKLSIACQEFRSRFIDQFETRGGDEIPVAPFWRAFRAARLF